jgi:hypothetical protein
VIMATIPKISLTNYIVISVGAEFQIYIDILLWKACLEQAV